MFYVKINTDMTSQYEKLLKKMYETRCGSDVIITLKDDNETITMYLHKCILSSACDFFGKMFDFQKNDSYTLNVRHARSMSDLIKSFYYHAEQEANLTDWLFILESCIARNYLCMPVDVTHFCQLRIPSEGFDFLLHVISACNFPHDKNIIRMVRRNMISYEKLSDNNKQILNDLKIIPYKPRVVFCGATHTVNDSCHNIMKTLDIDSNVQKETYDTYHDASFVSAYYKHKIMIITHSTEYATTFCEHDRLWDVYRHITAIPVSNVKYIQYVNKSKGLFIFCANSLFYYDRITRILKPIPIQPSPHIPQMLWNSELLINANSDGTCISCYYILRGDELERIKICMLLIDIKSLSTMFIVGEHRIVSGNININPENYRFQYLTRNKDKITYQSYKDTFLESLLNHVYEDMIISRDKSCILYYNKNCLKMYRREDPSKIHYEQTFPTYIRNLYLSNNEKFYIIITDHMYIFDMTTHKLVNNVIYAQNAIPKLYNVHFSF